MKKNDLKTLRDLTIKNNHICKRAFRATWQRPRVKLKEHNIKLSPSNSKGR